MSDVAKRGRVDRLLTLQHFADALETANQIADPWYRCQALSAVAACAPEPGTAMKLVRRSFDAAAEQHEPNRMVTVSAWPLTVLCQLGSAEDLSRELARLLQAIATEPHSVRRIDALFQVLKSLREAPRSIFDNALSVFLNDCRTCCSWKKDRSLREVAAWFVKSDPVKAQQIAGLIYNPRVRRRAFRALTSPDS